METLDFTLVWFGVMCHRNTFALDVEIALTLAHHIVDIRAYFPDYDHSHYLLMVQYLAKLTIGNLKRAMKMVDILVDHPVLMSAFGKERQLHLWNTVDPPLRAQIHRTEQILWTIQRMEGSIVISDEEITEQLLIPCSHYFRKTARKVMRQGVRREDRSGSTYYFHVVLMKAMFNFCHEMPVASSQISHMAEMVKCTANIMRHHINVGDFCKRT